MKTLFIITILLLLFTFHQTPIQKMHCRSVSWVYTYIYVYLNRNNCTGLYCFLYLFYMLSYSNIHLFICYVLCAAWRYYKSLFHCTMRRIFRKWILLLWKFIIQDKDFISGLCIQRVIYHCLLYMFWWLCCVIIFQSRETSCEWTNSLLTCAQWILKCEKSLLWHHGI